MTTAFVLSGGGSLGAVQVGMLQALAASHVEPDLLVGTSAGAVNASWVATHGMTTGSLADLATVWTRLRRADLFPLDARMVLRGITGRSPAITCANRMRQLVSTHCPIESLEDAGVPVHLVATDLLSGRDVTISTGSAVAGVLASAAIPGIFPPVPHDGHHLIDGALAQHVGVRQAVDLGATLIYVLPTGTPCALSRPPRTAVGMALHSLTLLIQRLIHEMRRPRRSRTSRSCLPCVPLRVSAATSATPQS